MTSGARVGGEWLLIADSLTKDGRPNATPKVSVNGHDDQGLISIRVSVKMIRFFEC